jgi:hypothetical protein
LTGLAVNVTEVPGQIAPEGEGRMLTEGVTAGFTVMVIEAVAVTGLAQVAFEIITQLTTSLLFSALLL